MAKTMGMKLALMIAANTETVQATTMTSNEFSDPLGKVNQLLNELKAKIIKEGEDEAKAYEEYVHWCHTSSADLEYEIKNYDKIKEQQEAKVKELASDIQVAESKIEELSAAISTNQGELDQATSIRAKEHSDFLATEKELTQAIDQLERAISIISEEMKKNPAALAQIDKTSVSTMLMSIGSVVEAAGVSTFNKEKLAAFIQSRQDAEDGAGAPSVANYNSQSDGIVTVLENILEKAQDELAEARKVEGNAKHNFNMMKQSLEDQMAADTKDMNSEKAGKEDAASEKATTEGDLATTEPNLENNIKSRETHKHDCMQSATDHEATTAARNEEIKVIANAIQILKEEASGAGEISRAIFNKYSFLQTSSMSKTRMQTKQDLANNEAAALVKKLAKQQHSAALAQLASQIAVVAKYGGREGADPFEKIKGLISQMIDKLVREAEADATEKAWCDEQMGKTEAKKGELEHDHAKLVAKIDKAAARAAEIKERNRQTHEEIAELQSSLTKLHSIRTEEHSNFVNAKNDLESGMAGVQRVNDILIRYYGNSAALIQQPTPPQRHEKSNQAGAAIIQILDVVESDFAKTLAKEESQEADADAEFKEVFDEKAFSKMRKEKDLQYKKQELVGLEKEISELANDKAGKDNELSAVLQYYGQVQARCVAKPHSYEDRRARREAEINGLKEALATLETEAAFVQRKGRSMRGSNVLQ